MINANVIAADLAPFNDVGTAPPSISETGGSVLVRMTRRGVGASVKLDKSDGSVSYDDGGEIPERFVSFRSLLASPHFGDLKSWASAQHSVLRTQIDESALIPISGSMYPPIDIGIANIDDVNQFLTENNNDTGRVLLVDGPAGIGKTDLISQIALRRARDFVQSQDPLILHVKSRGRILTYLQDLMAFSLQAMRLSVTYDQVPVLAKYGLVQIAIDGFDELGDPNGYDTAWGQIRDLVESIEGGGVLILSGRETFIGRERVLKAIPRLQDDNYSVAVFSINPVHPATARDWLRSRISHSGIDHLNDNGLFEENSYALRPFFLSRIAELFEDNALWTKPPLIALVEAMIHREAGKFPDSVQSVLGAKGVENLISIILEESARDIAETQSDSIDNDTMIWIVEAGLGNEFDSDIARIVKNRVAALAFLENDDRAGRRRFSHSEFFNYFLSKSTVNCVSESIIPKFIRRNILGPDFLLTFADVIEYQSPARVATFASAALEAFRQSSGLDRSARNLTALILAGVSLPSDLWVQKLVGAEADDVVVRGKANTFELSDAQLNQLDVRGSDLRSITFDNVAVATLIVDSTTVLSSTFPEVGWLQLIDSGKEIVLIDRSASNWIDTHGRKDKNTSRLSTLSETAAESSEFILLERICRVMLRQHWIRSGSDDPATRLLADPDWQDLRDKLVRANLLEERRDKQASGQASVFYHIRHASDILTRDDSIVPVRNLFLLVSGDNIAYT